jgi:hypothetical protein
MRLRKMLLGVAAIALPLGVLAVAIQPTMASAASPKTVGTGTYNCKDITGTLKFNPPLTLAGGASSETVTVTTSSTSCKGGTPKVKTSASSATFTTDSNACSSLSTGQSFSTAITYTNGASSSTFAGTSSSSTGPPVSFTVTGTVTGSYPSSTASTTVNLQQTETQIINKCQSTKGLKKLTIASGTSTDL